MAQQRGLSKAEAKFHQLKWVVGTWERLGMREDRSGFEHWTATSDSLYEGIGVTTEQGDTVFVEVLQIVKKDSTLYYVADVAENPSPVWFEIIEVSDIFFECVNEEHDFPQRIAYHLKGRELDILLSGDNKANEYRFEKKGK